MLGALISKNMFGSFTLESTLGSQNLKGICGSFVLAGRRVFNIGRKLQAFILEGWTRFFISGEAQTLLLREGKSYFCIAG